MDSLRFLLDGEVIEVADVDPTRSVLQFVRSRSSRSRLPVASASALTSAGASGGVPGSPTPDGGSADGTMCTSIAGISSIRSGR